MTESSPKTAFFGWRVVWAAFVLAIFGWGVGFYGPSIYLHSVVARTGWPVNLVSAAVTVHFVVGALAVAILPGVYRRLGVAPVTAAGAGALALGVCGWALAAAPWQLFAATLLSGAGRAAMGAAALNALIAPWFDRKRPAALSTAYNGASVGGILLSPLWVALIARWDFATAALLVGATMTILVCGLSRWVFAHGPAALGQCPDGAPAAPPAPAEPQRLSGAALWRDRGFATLAAGMAIGLFAQIGLVAHLFSILAPPLGSEAAGLALSLATAAAIAGRSLVGWLMPPAADRRLVAAASYGVQLLGTLLFVIAGNGPLLWLAILLFGAGIGNATSLPPLIVQAEFAREEVQRVVSLIVATAQASFAFAPAAFGLLRNGTAGVLGLAPHDTSLFFAAAAAAQLAAIACFLLGRRRAPMLPAAGCL